MTARNDSWQANLGIVSHQLEMSEAASFLPEGVKHAAIELMERRRAGWAQRKLGDIH